MLNVSNQYKNLSLVAHFHFYFTTRFAVVVGRTSHLLTVETTITVCFLNVASFNNIYTSIMCPMILGHNMCKARKCSFNLSV